MLGDRPIKKVMLGDRLVWESYQGNIIKGVSTRKNGEMKMIINDTEYIKTTDSEGNFEYRIDDDITSITQFYTYTYGSYIVELDFSKCKLKFNSFAYLINSCGNITKFLFPNKKESLTTYSILGFAWGAEKLKSIDLSVFFAGKKISDMRNAFNRCLSLESINISNVIFDGQFFYAFQRCESLKNIIAEGANILKTIEFQDSPLTLQSAINVLDALQPVTTAQTITFSAYTTSLINASNNALAKVYDTVQKGWTIVGEGLKDYVELEWIKKEANDNYRVVPSISKRTDDMRIGVEFYTRESNTKDFLIGYLWQRGNPDSTIAILQQSGLLFFYYGLSAFNIAVKENEKIYAEVDRDGGYINGKKVGSFDEQSLASSTSNITLFGIEGTSFNCEVKISKYTISTASTYEEFVPIRKTDDGTIRLFDRINNSYGNVHGTGTLSGGEPKQD